MLICKLKLEIKIFHRTDHQENQESSQPPAQILNSEFNLKSVHDRSFFTEMSHD